MNFKYIIARSACSLLLLSLIGCSKDDAPEIEIAYGFQELEVAFHTEGESTAPVVQWHGETGIFLLKNPVDGISIDANTGMLSWKNSLPLGENNITIVAQNQKSQTEISLLIKSTLAETYWLGWQNNDTEGGSPVTAFVSRQFKLNRDGSVSSKIINEEGSEGVGTWAINENTVEMHLCSYCAEMDPFSIPEYDEHAFYSGILTNLGDEGASVKGQWYRIDLNPNVTTLRGQFGLVISNENFEL